MEATGNTRHFKEAIKDLVSKVVVVNPNQFEVIRQSVKKTDRHDARTLAKFLSKEMLPESRLKQPVHAQLNSVAHTRDKLVKLRTTLINKLHALHVAAGIKSKKSSFSSVKGLKAALAGSWDGLTRAEPEVIVSQIGSLNALVQCTLVDVRYSPYLKNFYGRIKVKKGAGKAIIATARKFLGIIYRALKYNWVFADFPNFVLAED